MRRRAVIAGSGLAGLTCTLQRFDALEAGACRAA
jgi:anaerobic glycerol-3-phosphate dehydrogenase